MGCTSLTVWLEFGVFISDNRGRIHVWIPREEPKDGVEGRTYKSYIKTVYNGNPAHVPYRPMENIACDKMGLYLAGTDWAGLNYLWTINRSEYEDESGETICDLSFSEVPNWDKNPAPLNPIGWDTYYLEYNKHHYLRVV